MLVHTGKYRTGDRRQLKMQTIKTKHNPGKKATHNTAKKLPFH